MAGRQALRGQFPWECPGFTSTDCPECPGHMCTRDPALAEAGVDPGVRRLSVSWPCNAAVSHCAEEARSHVAGPGSSPGPQAHTENPAGRRPGAEDCHALGPVGSVCAPCTRSGSLRTAKQVNRGQKGDCLCVGDARPAQGCIAAVLSVVRSLGLHVSCYLPWPW